MDTNTAIKITQRAKSKLTHLPLKERLVVLAEQMNRPPAPPEYYEIVGKLIHLTQNRVRLAESSGYDLEWFDWVFETCFGPEWYEEVWPGTAIKNEISRDLIFLKREIKSLEKKLENLRPVYEVSVQEANFLLETYLKN